ncbi:MAG: hypothetical protein J1E85_06850 [Ruminococcus sp.]|nr:hypothetical protein [Ruminococcus sp.]
MTDIRFDMESLADVQKSASNMENLSELLEQESRRYSRVLSQESEARAK